MTDYRQKANQHHSKGEHAYSAGLARPLDDNGSAMPESVKQITAVSNNGWAISDLSAQFDYQLPIKTHITTPFLITVSLRIKAKPCIPGPKQ